MRTELFKEVIENWWNNWENSMPKPEYISKILKLLKDEDGLEFDLVIGKWNK